MDSPSLSLYELNSLVRRTLELTMPDAYWVRAEVARINENRGHCYLELVQKDERGYAVMARANANCWASTWMMLRPYFERTTGQRISAGMQLLVRVKVTFHEQYGMSLSIVDIDPTFTMGDMARRRMEIIRQLKAEGVMDMNKELPLPRLLQRVAVISSATAAGYGDFCNQLHNNARRLAFHTELFQATMQGNDVEQSIIAALDSIAERMDEWDVVVIIRGGGAVVDLAGFDTLALAEHVAQFPLPIITGIGHERDDTVLDLVSHTRVKTPTAAAELLIHHQEAELDLLEAMSDSITSNVQQLLRDETVRIKMLTSQVPTLFAEAKSREQLKLSNAIMAMKHAAQQSISQWKNGIDMQQQRMQLTVPQLIVSHLNKLQLMTTHIDAASPERILNLGYSIARVNGVAVKDGTELHDGDVMETTFAKGKTISIIKK